MISATTRLQTGTVGLTEPAKSGSNHAGKILSRFHALMLQQAFKTMLQSDPAGVGKSSFARDVWRDQLAEKLAAAATQSGGLNHQGTSDKP